MKPSLEQFCATLRFVPEYSPGSSDCFPTLAIVFPEDSPRAQVSNSRDMLALSVTGETALGMRHRRRHQF